MLNRSLSEAVSELKKNWLQVVRAEDIESACRGCGVRWRERVLDPVSTVQLLLLQVLNGNTAITQLRYFTEKEFSASAYCQARIRLPVEVLKTLFERMTASVRRATEQRAGDRRFFLVDGSSFSMPDTSESRAHFGQPSGQKPGCGFPVAGFIALMHAGSGLIQELIPGPLYSHDLARIIQLHPALKRGDVIVGDRAFCSFAHLAFLAARRVDAVFRMHQKQIVSFRARRSHSAIKKGGTRSRWEKKLGVRDQLVFWFRPKALPSWSTEAQYNALPEQLLLRELSYNVHRQGFRVQKVCLVTTLVDEAEFSKEMLAEIYRERWHIETNFKHLKTTMRMDVLRCKTVEGVLRELYAYCIVYNAVCSLIRSEAESRHCAPQQISFIDALRWLIAACQQKPRVTILLVRQRPNRSEPRATKRRPKQYDLLVKPRKLYKLHTARA